jgi:hypothetical protein
VEQTKVVKGSLVLASDDKLAVLSETGVVVKLPSNFKGPCFNEFAPVVLAKREADLADKRFLCVFDLEGQRKAVVLSGPDLCRTTSKGKRFLPKGAKLVYFGEGSYSVPWLSKRKKTLNLTLTSVKPGKPGAKGVKVATLSELEVYQGS